MTNPLPTGALAGTVAVVTGSSRGIGAATARYLAAAGATVFVSYRSKAPRAERLVAEIVADGGTARAIGADLTDPGAVAGFASTVALDAGRVDLLILNASGGMEAGMAEDYAMRLNRDAQVQTLAAFRPLLVRGSRVVFVTSHQAHFVRATPTLPEYEPVALSKRAGEDALRRLIPELDAAGIGFVVVSGDMIEGTITATLLERASPGALATRREAAGRLYSVDEFAAEVALAATQPIPEDHVRYVGDVSGFRGA